MLPCSGTRPGSARVFSAHTDAPELDVGGTGGGGTSRFYQGPLAATQPQQQQGGSSAAQVPAPPAGTSHQLDP